MHIKERVLPLCQIYIDHPDESAKSVSVCARLLRIFVCVCLQQLHLIPIRFLSQTWPSLKAAQSLYPFDSHSKLQPRVLLFWSLDHPFFFFASFFTPLPNWIEVFVALAPYGWCWFAQLPDLVCPSSTPFLSLQRPEWQRHHVRPGQRLLTDEEPAGAVSVTLQLSLWVGAPDGAFISNWV